jgi:photosystem II stability/assembly factor-like uncharacterized protein
VRLCIAAALVLFCATARADAAGLAWRNIGPAGAGGRVAAVAGTNLDPMLYYFGAAGGGVFKTANGGLTWQDVWPSSAVGAIGAVTIAPSNPDVVWVGTGESTPRNDSSYGDGVWVTHDGGAHWRHAGLSGTYAVARIIVDPHDPNVAVVGALGNPFLDSRDRGVYRTTDGGRTWHHTLYVGPRSGVCDLAYDHSHPNVIYAGIYEFRRKPWTFTSGGAQDGIYRSTDGGVTWHELHGGGLPSGLMGRIGLAVAPSDSKRVYALIQSKAGLLWRSDDGGAHWRMMSQNTLIDQRPFYMSRLAVDPRDPNRVYFASENLVETRDGGKTFEDVSSAVHQDHHGFWISSNGRRIIDANDGSAAISLDGGKTWDWRFNVTIGQVYHVGYDEQNPYHVCAALQDNDSFCAPNLSLSPLGLQNADWRDVANDSDGVWAVPQPDHPNLIWNVGVNELTGQLGIFDLRSRQNDDVTPDVTDTNGRALAGLPYRFDWEAPIAFSPERPGVAYFGANVVFATKDSGRTWTAISPDLTRNDPAKQQVAGGPINTDVSGAEFYDALLDIAPSPVDPKVIWVGTDDGVIARTTDGGASWKRVQPAWIAPWGRVEAVEPSHVSADRAYAVVDRHLLGDRKPYAIVTDDGGESWRPIANGLPKNQPVHVVREDPKNPDVLFAGLEQGVWMSLDRGAHWESLRLNMPPVAVYDLQIQPQRDDLIAGTHGRGVYILDDLSALEGLAQARASLRPVLFPIRPAYEWYYWWRTQYGTWDTSCCSPTGTFSAADPAYGALLTYYLPKGDDAPVRIEVLDSRGALVRSLPAPAGAGLHRVAWDLAGSPPVPWHDTGGWNQGPSDGPPVVPGAYRAVLIQGARRDEIPFTVLPDPRASWTHADYEARYAFLFELDDKLSAIDVALNRLDALRVHASPAMLRAIDAVYHDFTSGVRNSEDDMWSPDRVRERVTILQGDVALSQGPPLPPHLREAAAICREYDEAMVKYRQFLSHWNIEENKQ